MIRAFEVNPEWEFSGGQDGEPIRRVDVWHGRRAIDLRWVASAVPRTDESCSISMCGASGSTFAIRCAYEAFMILWLKAKGIDP